MRMSVYACTRLATVFDQSRDIHRNLVILYELMFSCFKLYIIDDDDDNEFIIVQMITVGLHVRM